jgi:hypothetical protein
MTRLVAVAFAFTLASSALAMTPARLQQPGERIIMIRHACGPGMHYVNGACIRTLPDVRPAGARGE